MWCKKVLLVALFAYFEVIVQAGWQSPVYQNFFSVSLPIAPIKQPKAYVLIYFFQSQIITTQEY